MSNKRIYSAKELPNFTPWKPLLLEEPFPEPPPAEDYQAEPRLDVISPTDISGIETNDQPSEVPPEDGIQLLSAEHLQAISEQAWQEGYAAGNRDAQTQAETNRQIISGLLGQIEAAAQQLESDLAPRVLDLAIDLARHILRSELSIKPEHVINLVRELTQTLPLPASHPKLRLHPEDAALVRNELGDELEPLGWKILPDSSLQRGDCQIETNHSELDGRLASRWQHLMMSLGLDKRLDDDTA